MPCFRPVQAYRTDNVSSETHKRQITFSRNSGYVDMPLKVPCGKCLGCLSKKTNEWALRCTHESQFHDESCFITLTYDDDNLPEDGGLHHEHFQKFMKRLRKSIGGKKIKYFMCGEYGSLRQRPHFHALIFGHEFKDMEFHSTSGKVKNYVSEQLSVLWPFGFHTIGSVHYGTARYVAKYSLKGMEDAGIDYGERRPEYRKMSQGIGSSYAIKYKKDIQAHDNIIQNGHKNPVPKYYENYLDPDVLQDMKDERIKLMSRRPKLFESDYRIMEKLAIAKAKLYEKH